MQTEPIELQRILELARSVSEVVRPYGFHRRVRDMADDVLEEFLTDCSELCNWVLRLHERGKLTVSE